MSGQRWEGHDYNHGDNYMFNSTCSGCVAEVCAKLAQAESALRWMLDANDGCEEEEDQIYAIHLARAYFATASGSESAAGAHAPNALVPDLGKITWPDGYVDPAVTPPVTCWCGELMGGCADCLAFARATRKPRSPAPAREVVCVHCGNSGYVYSGFGPDHYKQRCVCGTGLAPGEEKR